MKTYSPLKKILPALILAAFMPVQAAEVVGKYDLGKSVLWWDKAALSTDGSVVAGRAYNDSRNWHAVVWRGKDYGDKLDLGKLTINYNSGFSGVNALNFDGSVAAGYTSNNSEAYRAIVWRGQNYSEKFDLDTLRSDNSGWSQVNALSSDGSVAAGYANNDIEAYHAVIWRGQNYGEKLPLRTPNLGRSEVNALSSDGSVAAGYASNDEG